MFVRLSENVTTGIVVWYVRTHATHRPRISAVSLPFGLLLEFLQVFQLFMAILEIFYYCSLIFGCSIFIGFYERNLISQIYVFIARE